MPNKNEKGGHFSFEKTHFFKSLKEKIKVVEQVLRKADFSFFTFSNKICNVDFVKAETTSPVARLKVPPTTPGCD